MSGRLALLLVWIAVLVPQGRLLAWDSPREVVHGTARCLEKGEMIIGILSPLGYGLHERVTLFTHPILDLLLTPNAWARMLVASSDSLGVALELGYQQSFLSVQQGSGTFPGYVQVGLVGTVGLGRKFQATLAGGYLSRFSQDEGGDKGGIYYRTGLDLLANRYNLLMLRVTGELASGTFSPTRPSVSVIYARDFGRTRLGVGAYVGDPGAMANEVLDGWPVYPWLDFWWRF